jgi:hypothetical protein
MAPNADKTQQMRDLMLELTSDEEDDKNESSRPTQSRGVTSSSSSSRPGNSSNRQRAAGGRSKAEQRVDGRLAFLKQQQGGRLPLFDAPDPGWVFNADPTVQYSNTTHSNGFISCSTVLSQSQ